MDFAAPVLGQWQQSGGLSQRDDQNRFSCSYFNAITPLHQYLRMNFTNYFSSNSIGARACWQAAVDAQPYLGWLRCIMPVVLSLVPRRRFSRSGGAAIGLGASV